MATWIRELVGIMRFPVFRFEDDCVLSQSIGGLFVTVHKGFASRYHGNETRGSDSLTVRIITCSARSIYVIEVGIKGRVRAQVKRS